MTGAGNIAKHCFRLQIKIRYNARTLTLVPALFPTRIYGKASTKSVEIMAIQLYKKHGCPAAAVIAAIFAVICTRPAAGDVFHLANGGRIVGREVTEEGTSDIMAIELAGGGKVQLRREDLKTQERSSDVLDEYQERARSAPSTVEAQWELAEWCRTHSLKEQRANHLRRIIELDPDHQQARRALGYVHLKGEWITREQVNKRDGYVLFEGHWRTPQEVELITERKALRDAQIEWSKKMRRWRTAILKGKPHDAQDAHNQFLQINDAVAIDPLVDLITIEPIRELKMFYLRILCNISHPRAVHHLTYLTLVDQDDDVFDLCIREVVKRRQPETLTTYVRALKNANNFCVNRAAICLLRLEDKAAIGPLIDSLVTVHAVRTPPRTLPGGMPASEDTITFATDDSGKSTPVSERKLPPVILVRVANQDVLASLVELSNGMSFGFNQDAWRRWYASVRQQTPSVATNREAP